MDEHKLGLYKKLKIDKVEKDLKEIQPAGEQSILLIAKRLEKELIDQGYAVGIHITIWHFESGGFQVQIENKTIREDGL